MKEEKDKMWQLKGPFSLNKDEIALALGDYLVKKGETDPGNCNVFWYINVAESGKSFGDGKFKTIDVYLEYNQKED